MPYSADLKSIEGLIARLGGVDIGVKTEGTSGLLMEHLEAARRNLLGARRAEYQSSLEFAKESVACISSPADRAETNKILLGLMNSATQAPSARA